MYVVKKYDNMCQHGEDSPWLRRKGHERALNFNSTAGETILQENLYMIPVVCLFWDRNGVFVVTQILNIQIQWVSGQDHKPVTARIQDHGTVCDEVRNHLSRDYNIRRISPLTKSGHQSMCLSLATAGLTYWSWAWRTILTVIPCKAFSFSSVQASLSTVWSCITKLARRNLGCCTVWVVSSLGKITSC